MELDPSKTAMFDDEDIKSVFSELTVYQDRLRSIDTRIASVQEELQRLIFEKEGDHFPLPFKDQRRYWIIQEVYRQQETMYRTKTHSIEGRIVSISQPHIRPIVRGKSRTKVEFGAKLSASVVDGNVYLDRIGWEAYNENVDLPFQVESYRNRFGFYPEVVITDKIYGNRNNRAYLKERNIRYSGVPLGRPIRTRPGIGKTQRNKRKLDSNGYLRDEYRSLAEGYFCLCIKCYSKHCVLS